MVCSCDLSGVARWLLSPCPQSYVCKQNIETGESPVSDLAPLASYFSYKDMISGIAKCVMYYLILSMKNMNIFCV